MENEEKKICSICNKTHKEEDIFITDIDDKIYCEDCAEERGLFDDLPF